MGMLNEEDMATALICNLDNKRWDTDPTYPLDEEYGKLVAKIIREHRVFKAKMPEIREKICDEYCRFPLHVHNMSMCGMITDDQKENVLEENFCDKCPMKRLGI